MNEATFQLTEAELADCHKNPDVLRAIADTHDCREAEAEAMDCPGEFHRLRAAELRAEASRIESEY